MKTGFFILNFFLFFLTTNSQSIFSVLHLNEERTVHRGILRQITESRIFYVSDGTERKTELTRYDSVGLPASITFFDENREITSIVTYKYDPAMRVLLESNLNQIKVRFPTSNVRTVYQYQKAMSPIRILQLNSNGDVVTEVLLKNDSLGLPVELKLFEPPGNLIGSEIVSYLHGKNIAIVSILDSKENVLITDSMKISFLNAEKFDDINIRYNERGDVIFSLSKWRDGVFHFSEHEYVYDGIGNWIEQKSYNVTYKSNGGKKRQLKSEFKRTIVYWSN